MVSASTDQPSSVTSIRFLDGPNLYFTRAAVKVTLRPTNLLEASADDLAELARRLGLRGRGAPEAPGSDRRVFFVARLVEAALRQIARGAGVTRLGVRSRPDPAAGEIVVAFPWRRRTKAEALARALGATMADLVPFDGPDAHEARMRAASRLVAEADDGPRPAAVEPRIPTVAVTGTNGKTTVTRMVAHIARCAGETAGWCTSDGVYLDGRLLEAGDLTGFVGATTVLRSEGVTFAVLETARGGILRRGLGMAHNDVAVLTNISADHLGLGGINTLDQLAELKGTILRVTRPHGWVVLNLDDPRVFALRGSSRARVFGFSLDPGGPGARTVLAEGGAVITVIDGGIVTIGHGGPEPVCRVEDVPMTIAGLSRHNVANALAAAAAALGAGISRSAVVEGLTTFRPDPVSNPGRLNLWDVDGRLVIVDYGHNEEGLRALLEVADGLRPRGAAVRLVLNAVGDRTDDVLEAMGELACRGADHVVIAERDSALRGRSADDLYGILRRGLANLGCSGVDSAPSEVDATSRVLAAAAEGDVCAVMCHDKRAELFDWLERRGGTVVEPHVARRRVGGDDDRSAS